MLHADDSLPPDAIEAMMKVARSADDVVMVAGAERMNGVDRPHHFPPEVSVFEASAMLARTLVDEAHVPSAHTLYRIDAIREGEDFYGRNTIECAVEAVHRVLSRGGRAGFVHRYNADTRRYAESGSLIQTLAPKVKAVIWEKLLLHRALRACGAFQRGFRLRAAAVSARATTGASCGGSRRDAATWRCAI